MIDFNFETLFKGLWSFKRQVTGIFPEELTVEGQGYFTAGGQSNQRRYKEEGVYTRESQDIPFENTYLYELISPQQCRVLFPDGRLFYELSNVYQEIQHLCGEDKYGGQFEVRGLYRWQLSWQVTGPRKSYEIHTVYRR